jgi:hypothetical protein
MQKKYFLVVVTFGLLCLMATAGLAKKPWSMSLPDEICAAETIVIGKITKIRLHYVSVQFEAGPYAASTHYYDSAELQVSKVLKGGGPIDGTWRVIFRSSNHQSYRIYKSSDDFSVGEEGIWFLRREGFMHSFMLHEIVSLSESVEEAIVGGTCKK